MLSILIPAHNAERYIAAAIDSAAAQAVPGGTEILVCDDGSIDRTAQIVRAKMQDYPNLRLLQQDRNQGVCAARNRLLAEVHPASDFVAFLDADDVLLPDAYLPGLRILQAQPETQLTFGQFYIVPTHLLSLGRPLAENPPSRPGITLSAGVFRKGLIDRIGSFDRSLTQGEDLDFLLRISEICDRIVVHDDPLFFYRRHTTNATLNTAATRSGFLRALTLHMARRRANPALFDGKALINGMAFADPSVLQHTELRHDYTVVIPAYNAAMTIAETLQSVLAQTVPPLQIIVVDDGSTDDTAAIAANFSPLIRVISTENRGSGAATTTGVAAVNTPLVAMVDADDLWLPNKIERQLAVLLTGQPQPDAVLATMTPFGDVHLKTAPTESSGWTRSTLLIWTESFLRVGPVRDMNHGYGEMVDWFGRAKSEGLRFELLEEPLALRRIHPGSVSFQAGPGQARDFLTVARLALERKRRQG